ncbi:putative methyltransferase [Prunus yedoensis var. nudiflora]|uniref:Putative methyltransferase n=1 Tax=Prunus yedoensis var. nudiflora TaxID=2094558 RepID=A0A314URM7_PRUYE|nr:putative methyltransferase [Prunus yedoensis var. nudiflora]
MAGLFDKQADVYLEGRPTYPKEWYSKLAALTPHHTLAWDVGTGNGQAAISVAEHYEQVIGTDVNEEVIALVGGEDSVDLVTVAAAVHWFDLPKFYNLVSRVLKKPEGVLAVWTYSGIEVSPTFDPVMKRFQDTTLPFWDNRAQCAWGGYKTLPFPFQSVEGFGCEGNPLPLDIPTKLSFEGFLKFLRSWSAVTTAKDQGVDLLPEKVVKEFEAAWGDSKLVRSVSYKAFMLAGKVKL